MSTPTYTMTAPASFMTYVTRGGEFASNADSLIYNVPAGYALTDLIAQGCQITNAIPSPLASLPTALPSTPGVPWLNGGVVSVS
jgi:hypothetical protein